MATDLEDSDVTPDPPKKSSVSYVEIRKTTPRELDEHTEWYFVAIAENGEIVAEGETYTTKTDAKRGAEGVFPGVEIKEA